MTALQPLQRLFIPCALLLAVFFSIDKIPQLNSHYQNLLAYLPYLLGCIAMGLAHQFNRSRFFIAALLMMCSFFLVQRYLQQSLAIPETFYIYSLASVLVPLNLLALTGISERGLWNNYGIALLSALPVQILVAWLFFRHDPNVLQQIPLPLQELLSIKPLEGYILSIAGSLCFLFVFATSLYLLYRRNEETEASLLFCLVCSFITLAFFHHPYISITLFSVAPIGLIIGLLRSSHGMAYRDDLSGLRNRRALNEKLRGLGRNYVIAMMDVDHFKKFNDTHGHDVGDDVLKVVAQNIANVTGGGIPYRYGGEEFSVIFPGKSVEACIPHLEQVREAIAHHQIALRDKSNRPKDAEQGKTKRGKTGRQKTVSVTISIGVAYRNEDVTSPEQVIKESDNQLYKAKNNGRNCLSY